MTILSAEEFQIIYVDTLPFKGQDLVISLPRAQ